MSEKTVMKGSQKRRFDHNSFCPEEYEHIINLIVKHVFYWDSVNNKRYGIGCLVPSKRRTEPE